MVKLCLCIAIILDLIIVLITRIFWYLKRDLIICMTWIYLKENAPVQYLDTARNVFQAQPGRYMIQPVKLRLYDPMAIMMQPEITVCCICILRKVDETGITVFNDIIAQLLHDPENE